MKAYMALSALAVFLTTSALASGAGEEHPATASGGDCSMNYAMFEAAIPHMDLPDCPQDLMPGEPLFCRVSVANDEMHIYAFETEGFQCLRALRNVDAADVTIHFK